MERIKYLELLSTNEFFVYLKSLNNNQIIELIKNPYLDQLSTQKFGYVFFNLTFEQAQILLQNEKLYDKVINLPGKQNRPILNSLFENKQELLKLLLENRYILNNIDAFLEFIDYLSRDKIDKLTEMIDLTQISNYILSTKKDNIVKNMKQKFNDLPNDFYIAFCSKFDKGEIDIFKFLKIQNSKELILYIKFGVLVEISNLPEITLKNGLVLPYDKIISCKGKYITKLIQMLKEKSDDNDEILLEAAIKLYYIFGYDNSKKIIDDKFSFINESSLLKINDFEFKNNRREYRIKNHQEFYHHEMVDEILKSFTTDDNEIFKRLTHDKTDENIERISKEFGQIIIDYKGDEQTNEIKKKIAQIINERENYYKKLNLKALRERKFEDPNITAKFICDLFKEVQINKIMQYDEQTLKNLQDFLLGDTRASNDCLFRLILNNVAFGLENDVARLINDYKVIEQIIKKSKLSAHNIIDIVDILKVKLYELRPNEEEITLSTISRLINAVEYKENLDIDVIKETCKLHIDRKRKVYSSIPTVSGKTNNYTYEVAPFDAEYLLTAGLDAKNCFRIVGFGSDFFRYCLTSHNAVVVYLTDNDGNKHICPVIRTGNAISCNGIDPEVLDDKKKLALDALSQCFSDMIRASYNPLNEHYENIEVATISNLHMESFFEKNKYPKYNLQQYIPIDCNCYTDYNKEETSHYVLASLKTYSKNYYYDSQSKFYQKRDEIYEYDTTEEYDKDKISLIINSIAYSAIDYMNIPEKEKNKRKRNFKKLDIMSFKYIAGNKDWFVAIDENYNIEAKVLPYDLRCKMEYVQALMKTTETIRKLTGDSFDRKSL